MDFNIEDAFARVNDKLDRLGEMSTTTRTQMTGLVGNGQPGRIGVIEEDVDQLKEYKNTVKGWILGVGGIIVALGGLIHYLVDLMLMRGK